MIRSTEIYISGRTKRRLRWIAKAIGTADLTADALADQFLTEVIEDRFPQVKELEQEYDAAEKRLRESLKSL